MDFKELAISSGLYRPARSVYRHLNRGQLRRYRVGRAFYASLLKPNALCFDVGAKTGEITEMLLEVGASVVAFEPQADCMRELRARCSHHSKRLRSVQSAVGASVGEATLHIRPFRGSSSLKEDWHGTVESTARVPITTLDTAITEFGQPDYCKIDVEGWELEVLRGVTQPIPLVSFEYHLGQQDIARTVACLERLSTWGDLSVNITPAESLVFTFPTWISLPDFLKRYPSEFRGDPRHEYGDIFVRLETA